MLRVFAPLGGVISDVDVAMTFAEELELDEPDELDCSGRMATFEEAAGVHNQVVTQK